MKIAWFSELPLSGKVDRSYENMRTEFAWFVAQDSDHHNIRLLPTLPDKSYDVGIIIIPKNLSPYVKLNIVAELKRVCGKYSFMQEGPSWFFQSLPLDQCLWFYGIMLQADFVLCHNDIDREYYQGLFPDKEVFINPTLMIEDSIKDLPKNEDRREGILLGGNLVRWYGGFNSFIVAQGMGEKITAPMMGRMDQLEINLDGLHHIKYTNWLNWMREVNKFKYAIHLNPNTIGGTFSVNTAKLKIPTIGNIHSNTQRHCFPDLSIEPHDLGRARELLKALIKDKDFYEECAMKAGENYANYYTESIYQKKWSDILSTVFSSYS